MPDIYENASALSAADQINYGHKQYASRTAGENHLAQNVGTVGFQHDGLFCPVENRVKRGGGVRFKTNGVDAFLRAFSSCEVVKALEHILMLEIKDLVRAARQSAPLERSKAEFY